MKFLSAILLGLAALIAAAQDFSIELDRPNAMYKCGEKAIFTVAAPGFDGAATVHFRKEKQDLLYETDVDFSKQNPAIFELTLDEPGFIWCTVNNPDNVYRPNPIASAGFDAEKIVPTTVDPGDFDEFWAEGIAEAQSTPLDLKLEKMDDFTDKDYTAYRVSYANIGDSRVYGFLAVPNGEGPFPVIISVPGAGPGATGPDLAVFRHPKVMRLVLNVHDYDPRDVQEAWKELNAHGTYSYQGAPDPEKYYHRRGILGVNRALEAIEELPWWDKKHVGLWGSSQGGAYALIIAGLNPGGRIDLAVSNVPAMCEHTAYLDGRSAGWPLLIANTPEGSIEMAPYFDVVNFARRLDCPVMVGVGLIDIACGPSSVYAACNEIKSPKKIWPSPKMGHSFDQDFMKAATLEMYKALEVAK